MAEAFHRGTLHALGRRRIVIDRHRHRGRKTKTRQAFPAAGRGITTRTAIAQVSLCQAGAGLTRATPRCHRPRSQPETAGRGTGRPPGATTGPPACLSRSATKTQRCHTAHRMPPQTPIKLKSMALAAGIRLASTQTKE